MISVRPERIRWLLPGEAAENTIEGVVKDQTFAGSYVRCTIQACGQDLIIKTGEDGPAAAARLGQRVRIGWRTEDVDSLQGIGRRATPVPASRSAADRSPILSHRPVAGDERKPGRY
jgi:hypothetical protein